MYLKPGIKSLDQNSGDMEIKESLRASVFVEG